MASLVRGHMVGSVNMGLALAQVLVASFSGLFLSFTDFRDLLFWAGTLMLSLTIIIGMSLSLLDPQSPYDPPIHYGSIITIEHASRLLRPTSVNVASRYWY